jgi:N-terminal domain of anti-restriction factor ArdC
MASQTLTDDERAERRARERELVFDSVERLRSSDGWHQWLRTRARFRSYSFGNQLLIAHQHPTATRVAGFRAWLALGYCVQKGERSIRIWAPCPPSRRQLERWEHDGADPASKPRMGWRLAAVFAQDQVAPLPPPAVPAPLDPPGRDVDGDDLAELVLPLRKLAAEIGSSVTFEPVAGSAHSYYELRTKRIVVDVSLSPNQQIKTLIPWRRLCIRTFGMPGEKSLPRCLSPDHLEGGCGGDKGPSDRRRGASCVARGGAAMVAARSPERGPLRCCGLRRAPGQAVGVLARLA